MSCAEEIDVTNAADSSTNTAFRSHIDEEVAEGF